MKKFTLALLSLAAALLLFSAPAMAMASPTEYSFNYLFNGSSSWSTLNQSGGETFTDVPVSISFDTSKASGTITTAGADYYVFDLPDVSVNVGGTSWTSYLPSGLSTQVFVSLADSNLYAMVVDFKSEIGNWYAKVISSLSIAAIALEVEASFSEKEISGSTVIRDNLTTVSGTLSPTPIPGAVWLLGSGLLGLIGLRRRSNA